MTMKSRFVGASAAALVVWSGLGCSGIMGYGEELGASTVQSGQDFTIDFSPNPEALDGHTVWLSYNIDHKQPYRIQGSFELWQQDAVVQTWQVDFTNNGSPVVGGSGRFTMNTSESQINGKGSARGTIRLTALPALLDEPAVVRGMLTADSGTRVQNTRVVVTD